MNSDERADRFMMVRLIFFAAGIGTLLPWNFFITAIPYFIKKLGDPSLSDYNKTNPEYFNDQQKNFAAYLSLCSMFPLATFNILNLFFTRWFSLFTTAAFGGITIFLMFIITVILVEIPISVTVFLTLTLISIVLINASGAVYQGSIYGLAAVLPQNIFKFVLEGQAIAGVLAASVKLITLGSTTNANAEALSFFLIALIFLGISIIGILMVRKIPYFKYYWERETRGTIQVSETEDNEQKPNGIELKNDPELDAEKQEVKESAGVTIKAQVVMVLRTLREVLIPGLCIFFVINMTLIPFPTLLVTIVSTADASDNWKNKYFIQVIVFLSFNICDYIGRFLAGLLKRPRSNQMKLILVLACLRYLLVPFFLFMNQQPRKIPAVFTHDAIPIIFVIVVGLTNGYLLTLSFMYGPSFASPGNAAATGVSMGLYLTFGLATGVAISTGLLQII